MTDGVHFVKPRLYVYAIAPVDHWAGWTRLDRFVRQTCCLHHGPDYYSEASCNEDDSVALLVFAMEAAGLAARHGWEGDIRGTSLWVTADLPDPYQDQSRLVVAWKQDNNGLTFIASPEPIAKYENDDCRIYPPKSWQPSKVRA